MIVRSKSLRGIAGLVIGIPSQLNGDMRATMQFDGLPLHQRRGIGHEDRGMTSKLPGSDRYTLRMIASRSTDHPTATLLIGQCRHLVVCPTPLVGMDRWDVFALHPDIDVAADYDRLQGGRFAYGIDPLPSEQDFLMKLV